MIENLLGLERPPAELTLLNMSCRGVIVFITGVIILRIGARRSIGRNAGFDVLLSVVLGSVLSRGINGQAAFFPTLGVSLVLVLLHDLLGMLSTHFHCVSRWLKGSPRVLVRNGQVDHRLLRRSLLSADDLEENLRINGNIAQPAEVAEARLERNGEISVVKKRAGKGSTSDAVRPSAS